MPCRTNIQGKTTEDGILTRRFEKRSKPLWSVDIQKYAQYIYENYKISQLKYTAIYTAGN